MPSTRPVPTVRDFLLAGRQAVVGFVDDYADTRSGSMYDHMSGPYATLQARQALADRDKFRAIYINSAQGDDLTRIVTARLGVPRVLGNYGTGILSLQRPSDAGGGGTFWRATRYQVAGNPPGIYEVASDTPVSATALTANIPIQATVTGAGTAITAATALSTLDPVWDASWQPVSLTCAAGTEYEDAATYVARARQQLLQNRNGYLPKLQAACALVGATTAIGFASSAGLAAGDLGNDYGLSALYVGTAGYSSSPSLIATARLAIESCRVLGAELWIGGIAQSTAQVTAVVNLIDDPGNLPEIVISRACLQAALAYFPTYDIKIQALESAIAKSSPYIQSVTLSSPSVEVSVPSLVFSGGGIMPSSAFVSETWPATLTIYSATPQAVQITLAGPT